MEAYLYHGMAPESRVLHLMGEPQETRHLFVANEQAVLSPTWSIHSGAGIGEYTFIWAMAGTMSITPTWTSSSRRTCGDPFPLRDA
ncbi:hypothetical protein FLP41_09985 [Paracoccus marcusii]|uniref:hypothetical protein n=1 Tax=Paracoccus marcusii TaxID=59779 RepID=UPI002ED11D93|nr:hypothetical protein FLP41_09985 [Paracoccus marcusii]